MAKKTKAPKTPKQIAIKVRSLKKQITALEKKKKKAAKKKPAKKRRPARKKAKKKKR